MPFNVVKSLVQFPDGIQGSVGESLRLLHILDLVLGQDTIEKGCLDIKLLRIPVTNSSDVQEDTKRFESCSRSHSLGEILPIDLLVTLRNELYFMAHNSTSFVSFPATNKASPKDFPTHRD